METAELARQLERDGIARDFHLQARTFPAGPFPAPLRFARACFEDVDFSAADLAGAHFQDCTLLRCDLTRACLTEAHFERTRCYDPDAGAGCTLRFAELEGALFEGCDLSLCDLHGARAWNLRLLDCTAQGLTLDRTSFSRHPGRNITLTAFTAHRCNLSFGEFTGLHLVACDLSGSRLREAHLDDVDLSRANLAGCDLSGIQARRLKLQGADLRDAIATGLDPRQIDLAGVRIRAWQQQALLEAMGIQVEE